MTITKNGVEPNMQKINAIKGITRPKNIKHIKMFLGMTGYYRKFIKDFLTIAKPLTQLLKKDVEFVWSDKQETVLSTDVSNVRIRGVLSQIKNGNDLPVAYYSRTINKAEENYSTTEKELLTIVNFVENFRPYLYGNLFNIHTDRS